MAKVPTCRAPAPQPRAPDPNKSLQEGLKDIFAGDAFWDCFGARPIHFPAVSGQLGLVTIDELIGALILGSDTTATTAFKHGEPYFRDSPSNIFLAYLDHATLCLNDAEHYFPVLLQLCQELAESFDYVTSRLLLHPPGAAGPLAQLDHDVVLVQLWGQVGLTVAQPGPRGAAQRRAEPLLQTMLSAGDVVYVPRGSECRPDTITASPLGEYVASREPLLFLALTVRTPDQSLGSCLGRHLTDVLREKLPNDVDMFLRSSVTKHATAGAGPERDAKRSELQEQLSKSATEVASRINMAGIRKHHEARMESLREAQRAGAVKAAATLAEQGLPANKVSTASVVRISDGVECRCDRGSSFALFKRGTATLKLPIAKSASSMINELSDGRPHVVASLPCADPVERLSVCQVLIFKECLELGE